MISVFQVEDSSCCFIITISVVSFLKKNHIFNLYIFSMFIAVSASLNVFSMRKFCWALRYDIDWTIILLGPSIDIIHNNDFIVTVRYM